MVSEESIKTISQIFCGDIEGYYAYKSGSVLVSFFNEYFGYNERYGQGFPSRWAYVYDKIVEMLNAGTVDSFFSCILGKEYLMRDMDRTEVEAIEASKEIMAEFNKILRKDMFKITHSNSVFHLVAENDDLVLIGSGGFANVYRQKSTGKILKKLKDDFLGDEGIRSGFKREFQITKSLHGVNSYLGMQKNMQWRKTRKSNFLGDCATALMLALRKKVQNLALRHGCCRLIMS